MENIYYDGTKLLSLKDLKGEKPEIFICTSNRNAGKTTYFNRLLINRFKKTGEKFLLLYRYNYEIEQISEKFFSEISDLFFKNDVLTDKLKEKGVYSNLYLNDEHCGFATSLNRFKQIKLMSHLFKDVKTILFDEFQPEDDSYLNDEIQKFISIHTSMARGGGEQIRYLPVYIVGNPITLLNPYYSELGISARIQDNTNFLKGNGWVLEHGFNQSASEKQSKSKFNQAFSKNKYIEHAKEAIYLNDTQTFIEKINGNNQYICTIVHNKEKYSIRYYREKQIVYCSNKIDKEFPLILSAELKDHNIGQTLYASSIILELRKLFSAGLFRFKGLKEKEAIMTLLSY